MKNEKFGNSLIAMMVALSTFNGVMANDESYVGNNPIDINGYYKEPAPVTDQELEKVKKELDHQKQTIVLNKEKTKKYKELGKTTEKLADATEELIEERNDSQAEIEKYNKKISCLMGESNGPDCDEFVKNNDKVVAVQEVSTNQAAPVVIEEQVVVKAKKSNQIKVLPFAGLTTFNGQVENLESELSLGLRVESDINSRFSIGMGLGYTSMKTTDFGGVTPYFSYSFYNMYNNFYNGREIQYNNLKVDLYSKFFITRGERFRPYLGLGAAYNRTNLKYSNNNAFDQFNFNSFAYQFGNEELTTSMISMQLQGGSEIIFTDTIGMNLEIQYSKGIGNGFNTSNGLNATYAPDQKRLQDLNNEIGDADIISVFAGMLIVF